MIPPTSPTPPLPAPIPTTEMLEESLEDTVLLRFPTLALLNGFSHAVTTKPWNVAVHQGPEANLATTRRRKLCAHLGFSYDNLTAPDQIHSVHVIRIMPEDVGAGREGRHTAIPFVDGMVCDLPHVPLMQFSADCPLILAVEPTRRVFGMAHASWRGTVAHIAEELIHRLRSEFSVHPDALHVGIAPCAGPDDYEIGEDVARIIRTRVSNAEVYLRSHGAGRWLLDLRAANVAQLVGAGVARDRICVAALSTISDSRFFSHRRDGAETGRFCLIAGLV